MASSVALPSFPGLQSQGLVQTMDCMDFLCRFTGQLVNCEETFAEIDKKCTGSESITAHLIRGPV